MTDFLAKFILSFSTAAILSLFLGIFYFLVASAIVNLFGFNRGERSFGYHFFNAALFATLLSFFLIFAYLVKNISLTLI